MPLCSTEFQKDVPHENCPRISEEEYQAVRTQYEKWLEDHIDPGDDLRDQILAKYGKRYPSPVGDDRQTQRGWIISGHNIIPAINVYFAAVARNELGTGLLNPNMQV